MVLLHHQAPSRKRPSSSVPPLHPPKAAKSTNPPQKNDVAEAQAVDKMVSILAEAGCTLINPAGPPCLPSDPSTFRRHLQCLFFSSENAVALRSDFLSGFSYYIRSAHNLRRPVPLHVLIHLISNPFPILPSSPFISF